MRIVSEYTRRELKSNPRGAAHVCSGNSFRGGVSRRFTRRPEGQSTVEYVLIIAIIVLVVLIAGPWVSSAIRNQFNAVAGAIGSGTTGENFYEPEDIPDPQSGTAFAVYSEDDHSLMFYKRRGVPQVGDMFNYRRVTAVYTGIEEHTYGQVGYTHDTPDSEHWTAIKTNVPWFDIRDLVTSVKVVDSGVTPKSLAFWFYRFSNLKSADLSNLESSDITSIHYLFVLNSNLIGIKMPGLTGICTDYSDSFSTCHELTSLEMPACDFSNCNDFYCMFNDSGKLKIDCSDWNVPVNALHKDFNRYAPGVTLPKAWQ